MVVPVFSEPNLRSDLVRDVDTRKDVRATILETDGEGAGAADLGDDTFVFYKMRVGNDEGWMRAIHLRPPATAATSSLETSAAPSRTATFEGELSIGDSATHTYAVASGEGDLRATLSADVSDADLYAAVGEEVSRLTYDPKSWTRGSDESLSIPASELDAGGTVHFLVDAYAGSGPYTLTVVED